MLPKCLPRHHSLRNTHELYKLLRLFKPLSCPQEYMDCVTLRLNLLNPPAKRGNGPVIV